jgi:hypothetical protein
VGFVLYCLRWRYWPSLGAHICPHPLDDIQAIIVNPFEWNVDRFGWRKTVKFYIGYGLLQAVFVGACTRFNLRRKKRRSVLTLACYFFVAFHTFTVLERTFHMAANVFITVFSLVTLVLYEAQLIGQWSLGRLSPYLPEPFVIVSIMFTILVLSAMSFVWDLLKDPFGLDKTDANLQTARTTIWKLNGKNYRRRVITSQGTLSLTATGRSVPLRLTNGSVSAPSRGKVKVE